jgi:hypothetical protein
MTDISELPLFAWRPPAKIILFPLYAQRGHAARIAADLLGKQGAQANEFWKRVIATNRERLARLGLSEGEQDDQLQQLHDAVQDALTWTAINRHESNP